MENALLIGLSRQMSLRREMDVVAKNTANINPTVFNADTPILEQNHIPGARAVLAARPDQRLSYVVDRSTWHDMSQGPVHQTGNPLDVAINGDAFLVVQTPRGERYTRNGSLHINPQGQLVTTEGHPVVGENGPIQFQTNDRDITIGRDGSIGVPGGSRGKLRLVTFAAAQRLQKDGGSTFLAPQGVEPQPAAPAAAQVIQFSLEQSNVRGVIAMTRMIEVARNYTQVSTMLQQQGDMRRGSVEKLAEVPA